MADQDDRGADRLLHPPQGLDNLALDDDVEGAGRLVGDDHLRPQADGDGDHHALLHAAAELVRVAIGDARRQTYLLEQADDARLRPGPSRPLAVIAQRVDHLAADLQHRIERVHRALGHERNRRQPQPPHLLFRHRQEIDPVQPRFARLDSSGRLDQAQQRQGYGGFPRAGFPDQAEAFAASQIETDAVDRPDRTARRVIVHAQAANLENVWLHSTNGPPATRCRQGS